ncbi:dihydrofolate reductase family protein [Neomicrococcus lactis]|uniref:Dihydrofolate reductase n=1 Tax=Neomicrococcus lactis TaxID=732241 RepID=A0A7W8Y9E7_9MICC|nr:dihydrofolate reductase family protein [Neomicrococcus lactis]MBB5597383.1 dihydrofolate reductase [Neomicrococcus lactis]
MTRFVYFVAMSVDGYIADEADSLRWLEPFDKYDDGSTYESFLDTIGSIVMGADTYTWLLKNAKGEWPYKGIPTWVFAHRELPSFPGADVTFARGDIAEWASELARDAAGKDVWVMGGGALAGQFVDAEKLDELRLFTIPVILGGGRPLFAMRATGSLELTSIKQHDLGVVESIYLVTTTPHA